MSDSWLNVMFNRAQIDDRQVNELIGVAKGVIADGTVNQAEAELLRNWLIANTAAKQNPVVRTLLDRVNVMLRDGRLDREESVELLETLRNFSAGDIEIGELLRATRLPIDNPAPDILFSGRNFCFTGTFAFGSRRECEAAVIDLGGNASGLNQSTNYLVIGIYATDSWAHSPFGRKIERAVEWRDAGVPIALISEEHWRLTL